MPAPYYGRWNATEVLEKRLDSDWPTPTPYATNLIKPTSIASTGTGNSSSIGANGSVTFSSCATLSLDGVFSAAFDNYMIVIRHLGSTNSDALNMRLRSSGTDSSAANYVTQTLRSDGTTVDAVRLTAQTEYRIGSVENLLRYGLSANCFGPYLSQPTAFRSVGAEAEENARVYNTAGTHSLSTSYDGFTLIPASGTFTGLVSVYGLGQ